LDSADIGLKTPVGIPSVRLNTIPTLRIVILLTLALKIRWSVNARRSRQDCDKL
jgi:hypothetical protein